MENYIPYKVHRQMTVEMKNASVNVWGKMKGEYMNNMALYE